MKFSTLRLVVFLLGTIGLSTARGQNTVYWDTNDTAPGAADSEGFADGNWNTSETTWNPLADGTGTPAAWVAGDDAVFSAGNDVLNDPENSGAFVTIADTQTANSILIEEGYIAFRSGTADTGTGTLTINADATLDIDSTLRLNLSGGKVVLNGGTLLGTNPGQAGGFIGASAGEKGLEVNEIGFIGYNDGNGMPDDKVSIFSGVISGTGGTTDNGGAGTLVKIGPDQIGVGASDQGGQSSQELFTFAKLEVREGAYRLRHQGFDDDVRETAFGAVPLAELPDAITLDGGGIGTNASVTLHEFRGITIGPNGGYLDHGAGASLGISGPLSGSGTLMIGSPTSTSARSVTFTFSHPDNVNTFSGNLVVNRSVLQLDSSLTTPNFSGASPAEGVTGTVNVAAGQTFTFGSDDADTSFDGTVGGAGNWRKVGTGTTTFTGTENTHSGDTVIEAGTLSITDPYLADGGDVSLTTGATLNLDFAATDVINALLFDGVPQDVGTWGASGSGADFESDFLTGTGLLEVSALVGPGLTGDFNGDGVVNAADYVVWRDGLGGEFDASDYDDWRANFGAMQGLGSAAGAAVPEPAALALAAMSLLGMFGVTRRSRG